VPEATPRLMYMRRDGFDPVAELGQLRAQAPVSRLDAGPSRDLTWLATSHTAVREVLGDAKRFSTDRWRGASVYRPVGQAGNLLNYDPPAHTRLRKMLTPEFTVHRIRRLEPRIEALVAGRLDAMERAGPPVDLVPYFARPIPSVALCELLGVPRDDRAEFERRSTIHLDQTRDFAEREAYGFALHDYLAGLVARQRVDPDEDFLGMLVRQHGAELSDEELTGLGILMLLAGVDNISGMLGLGVLLLLQHPAQLALLREHPERIGHAVEEMLRFLSVTHAPTPRRAVSDVTISGQTIKAGDRVICSIPAANRDAALGAQPDRFDITREPASHVAFGHGIHHCVGAPLARMELRIGFRALLHRFPGLRLAVPFSDVHFRRNTPGYGVESLPVTW
jgi:cytochrome P450